MTTKTQMKFQVADYAIQAMRALLKKHPELQWTESGVALRDFEVTGPQEALDAFQKDFAEAEAEWLSNWAW